MNCECEKMKERVAKAEKVVNKYMWFSAGAGFIPMPVVDTVALSGVQMILLNELSKIYEVEFFKNKAKNIISTIVSALSADIASYATLSVVKFVPGVGTVLGLLSMPAYSAASTYALGKVFIQHFESGGTLLTFDPAKVRDYYKEMFEKGKEIYEESKKK